MFTLHGNFTFIFSGYKNNITRFSLPFLKKQASILNEHQYKLRLALGRETASHLLPKTVFLWRKMVQKLSQEWYLLKGKLLYLKGLYWYLIYSRFMLVPERYKGVTFEDTMPMTAFLPFFSEWVRAGMFLLWQSCMALFSYVFCFWVNMIIHTNSNALNSPCWMH